MLTGSIDFIDPIPRGAFGSRPRQRSDPGWDKIIPRRVKESSARDFEIWVLAASRNASAEQWPH